MEFAAAILLGIGLMIIVCIIISLPTMLLWNWLMPVIFGLPTITWLQALGLCILCSILFKSSGKVN